MKNMTANDSLDAIDRDLNEAVQFCLSSGLSSKQIAKDASPLLSMSSQSSSSLRFRSCMRRIVVVTVAVALIAFLVQNTWTFRWICVAGKSFQMKILPYWDWTTLYNEDCIIPNPYMTVAKLTEDDCEMCESYHKLDFVHNVSVEEVTDDYLFDNIPFIVTDATETWKAFKEFDYDSFKKLYTTDKVLRSHDVCDYRDLGDQRLAAILSNNKLSFHAFWVNCKLPAIKVFRSYYHRPYFLPPMVESAQDNFVAFSSGRSDSSQNWKDDQFLDYFSHNDMTWFAQIRGSYRIQLKPKVPCGNICKMLEVVLQEGQTMVLPNEMWELWFAPADNQPTIAIGSTGNWDS